MEPRWEAMDGVTTLQRGKLARNAPDAEDSRHSERFKYLYRKKPSDCRIDVVIRPSIQQQNTGTLRAVPIPSYRTDLQNKLADSRGERGVNGSSRPDGCAGPT